MKRMEAFFREHRTLAKGLILAFFIVMACFIFPFYNFTRQFSTALTASNLAVASGIFWELGRLERGMFPHFKWQHILALNLGIVLAGMVCRFFLEFGEVSNTYNFTLPNMTLHIPVTVGLSTFSWLLHSKK